MVDYVSDVDGSTHSYGLYVPSGYNTSTEGGFALVIHGGGYGYTADADFYKPWYDPYQAIFVNYDGRHRLQYDGVAEDDLLQVISDLKTHYNIDSTRIYFEGHSMGSTGALRTAIRHPDIFAAVAGGAGFVDYREWYERYYAEGPVGLGTEFSGPDWREALLQQSSVVDLAENAAHLQMYFTAGTYDTVNRPFGARNLDARLTELGYDHTFIEAPTAHQAGYTWYNAMSFFFDNDFTSDPYVSDVVYKTNQLKWNKAYWTRIDRMEKSLEWAEIRTDMSASDNRVDVNVSNILQYTLDLSDGLLQANGLDPLQPVNVYTNGMLSYSGPVAPVTLYASLASDRSVRGWSTTNTLPGGLVKNHDIEGPIGHAFESPFRLVYGTGYQAEADVFARDWNNTIGMSGNIGSVSVGSVTPEMISDDNMILFGTADTNELMRQAMFDTTLPFNVPVTVTDESITIGGRIYSTADFGIFMIYPNPLNPSKYIVISEGTLFDSNLGWQLETMPWAWPDFVVFDKTLIYDPLTMEDVQGYPFLPDFFVEAGFFDVNWQLDVVPEPATIVVFAAGVAAIGAVHRKRTRARHSAGR